MRNNARKATAALGISLLSMGALGMTACGTSQTKKNDGVSGTGAGLGPSSDVDPLGVLENKVPTRDVTKEEREDFDKALKTWQDIQARSSGKLSDGDCDRAADAFGRAADDNPSLQEARYNQGAVLLKCNHRDQAFSIFEKLAKGPKPYARAISDLGLAAWQRGDQAEAERMFVRAIEVDPNIDSVAARNNLAQILRDKMITSGGEARKGHAQQAIRHLRTVLAVDGNNIQAYATLCHVYYELELDDMAKLVGEQAIGRAAEIATGEYADAEDEETEDAADEAKGKGKRGRKGGDAPKAKAEGSKIKVAGTGYTPEMNEQLALVHNTLGLVELRKKNVSGALAQFSRAVDKDATLYEARMNRAAISLNFRNYEIAEGDFRAVIGAQPKNYAAALGLGVALRGNRKVDESEQQYLAAMKLDPANPASYYNLGLLYQDYKSGQKSDLQKAQEYYRQYLGKAASEAKTARAAVEKRIKNIDEMFVALEEAEKMQREYEEMLRKAEEQQKQMEEENKRMEEQQKQQAPGEAAPAGATTAPPQQSANPPGGGGTPAASR